MKAKKYIIKILLIITGSGAAYSQTPEFYFNGGADVILRYPLRGSGGRAIVHADGNELTLNYGGDFSGGTRLGNGFLVSNDGSFSSASKLTLLSNGNLGVQNSNPEVPLSVSGVSNFFPVRTETGSGDHRMFSVGASFVDQTFVNNTYPIVLSTGGGNQPLILNTARVGIGTVNPGEMLSVNGDIRAREIKVETFNWPDYVFEEKYRLKPLEELADYIRMNKHLPEMPSAKTVEIEGLAVGDIIKRQQRKIEELTLYLIEGDRILNLLLQRIDKLEGQIKNK
ncbi:MAG: hypothetical protein EOO45_00245 [Flavobacterium sp.]|nr:MAG: hypothetical protein EOO45_00245 [Flavobacterium sp.]